jgi:hypothetical protein
MKKPKKVTRSYYGYNDIIDYIEFKYKIKTRGYTPKCGFTEKQIALEYRPKPYLDFWHWIIDYYEVNNGSSIYLDLVDNYKYKKESDADWDGDSEQRPRWVREIQKMIFDEFKPKHGGMMVWIDW